MLSKEVKYKSRQNITLSYLLEGVLLTNNQFYIFNFGATGIYMIIYSKAVYLCMLCNKLFTHDLLDPVLLHNN